MGTRTRNLLFLSILLIVFIAACADGTVEAPAAEEPAAEEPAAEEVAAEEVAEEPMEEPTEEPMEEPTEEPMEEPTEEPMEEPLNPNASLDFVVGGLRPEEVDYLVRQVGVFQEMTGVEVLLEAVAGPDLQDKLYVMAAAGEVPDVSMMSYNLVASFQLEERVLALDGYVDPGAFLPDAVASNTFGGNLYALPWRRAACLPQYTNVAIFNDTSYPDEAAALVDYLTAEPQQRENQEALGWTPTLTELDQCGPLVAQPVRPIAENTSIIVRQVLEISEAAGIAPLNATLSTAAFAQESGEARGLAAAVAGIRNPDEFARELEQGALVGMVEVVDEMRLTDEYGDLIPSGIYFITVIGDQPVPEIYLEGDPGFYKLGPDVEQFMEQLDSSVGQSFTYVEEGSLRVCFSLDSRRICFGFG